MSTSFIIFAVVCVLLTIVAYKHAERQMTRPLRARPPVPPREWIVRLDPPPGEAETELLLEVINVIAGALRVEPAQLRPTDGFATDLNYRGIWRQLLIDGPPEIVSCELMVFLEKRGLCDLPFEKCTTIGALLATVLRHISRQDAHDLAKPPQP